MKQGGPDATADHTGRAGHKTLVTAKLGEIIDAYIRRADGADAGKELGVLEAAGGMSHANLHRRSRSRGDD